MDDLSSRLLETAKGKAEDLQESQSRLDDNWSELCALLEDREEELLKARADLLLVRCLDDIESLDVWFKDAVDNLESPVIVLSSATLEDAKELFGKYRVNEILIMRAFL